MNKNYETPSIEIINYQSEIELAASIVVNYPWSDADESGYFDEEV